MRFEDFIKDGKVRKSSVDPKLIQSLIKRSEKSLNFLKNLELTEENKEDLFVMYYESLRKIVESIAVSKGYKVYSHEAFTFLLKEIDEETISREFDRCRKLRNGINYYGREINISEVKSSVKIILKIIKDLKNKYLT